MYKYGDYFPRTMLYRCGISPDTALTVKDERAYFGAQRHAEVRGDMRAIFDSFAAALREKSAAEPEKAALEMGVGRRIVTAFYDMGILTERDREQYPTDGTGLFEQQRERLSIFELAEQVGDEKAHPAEVVAAPVFAKERGAL